MLLALSPLAMLPMFSFSAPQSLLQHPAPQRLRMYFYAIFLFQMFRCQRRPKTLTYRTAILLSHQLQCLLSEFRFVGMMRTLSRVAMLQPSGSFFAKPLPQTLGLPVTDPQQACCVRHPQFLALHTCQHFHTPQLFLAHPRPPQSDLLLEVLLGGHFYRGQKGTLSSWFNRKLS